MMQPFRGNEPIVVERRDDAGKLLFDEPQPPKFATTLDEVYQWQFADDAGALGTWEELKDWLDERGWKLRAKTW